MLKRVLLPPTKSFFLFGPRGCGKTTWLESMVPQSLFISLLESDRYLQLKRDPSALRKLTNHLPTQSWVIIDEIQRVPELLNEVHLIYEKKRIHFVLSGSSARKLKKSGANLLAGRALRELMFPLVHTEYEGVSSVADAIEWGTLPAIVTEPEHRAATLEAYIETYLKEDITSEALVRSLDPFVRFLGICGQYHGQLLNVENIARECGVKRPTVDRYLEILEETLIAYRLPSLQLGLKSKESSHSKFYLFDSGIARAAAGLTRDPVDSVWKGFSFESLVYLELLAYNSYAHRQRAIYHYSINQSYDVDFLIEVSKKTHAKKATYLAIEVKLSTSVRSAWFKPLIDMKAGLSEQLVKGIIVYLGGDEIKEAGVWILPFPKFCTLLQQGKIF